MNDELFKFIIENILEYAQDATNSERNEFNDAKRLAYYEVLNSIKNQLEVYDIEPKNYGLDFKLEDIL